MLYRITWIDWQLLSRRGTLLSKHTFGAEGSMREVNAVTVGALDIRTLQRGCFAVTGSAHAFQPFNADWVYAS
jgi:hypothetical protein